MKTDLATAIAAKKNEKAKLNALLKQGKVKIQKVKIKKAEELDAKLTESELFSIENQLYS